MSLSFSFILFLIPLLPCDVGIAALNSRRQAHENPTLQLLPLKLSLLAVTLCAGGYVALWRGFACSMSNKQTSEVFDDTAWPFCDHCTLKWPQKSLNVGNTERSKEDLIFLSSSLFVSQGAFSYKWCALWCTPHPILAICPPPIFPQSPWGDLGPPLRSPCHRRKLPNCQHICDSLVSTPSTNMAVKIAISVLDHLESNLIQASRKKGQIKTKCLN